MSELVYPPCIFNVFKPPRITSYDVIRHFKRNLPKGYGKIGHFGTLDPFASGVLMIGVAGAARLNDFVHHYLPKTYIAVGKLGYETPTGDFTSEVSQTDQSIYLRDNISQFSSSFIQERFQQKFLGEYWQAPHRYSASKYLGKNLHQWAREGVEIKKEPVKRYLYKIQILKYSYPYLCFRVEVSSGTYIRSLFQDFANELGTIGSLVSLVREKVGPIHIHNSLYKKHWPQKKPSDSMVECEDQKIWFEKTLFKSLKIQDVLEFSSFELNDDQEKIFRNGGFLEEENLQLIKSDIDHFNHSPHFWAIHQGQVLGLAERTLEGKIKAKLNFTNGLN